MDGVKPPAPPPDEVARLDVDIDTLFDRVAQLTARVTELEAPTPVRFPAHYWAYPLDKAIASVDQALADGIIDDALHGEAVHNLEVSDRFWREHPDALAIQVNLTEMIDRIDTTPRQRHLHAVDDTVERRASGEVTTRR